MPLTPPGIAAVLTPALMATGMLGLATPKYAFGVGTGVMKWAQQVIMLSVDVGTLGGGSSSGPLVVAPPVLMTNLLIAFGSLGILGVLSPLKALGLANGLSQAFMQATCLGSHASVGAGASINQFQSGPAAPFIIEGLASVGFQGGCTVKMATAIGLALDMTFKSLLLPMPILGPPSPIPSSGVGFGKIL